MAMNLFEIVGKTFIWIKIQFNSKMKGISGTFVPMTNTYNYHIKALIIIRLVYQNQIMNKNIYTTPKRKDQY